MAHEKIAFMGIGVNPITTPQFIDILVRWTTTNSGPRRFVTYLNAACANLAANDPDYREILNTADCVYADGLGVVWASQLLGETIPERVNAGDFIEELIVLIAQQGGSVALVGGRPGVADKAGEAWLKIAPGLNIVKSVPGYFQDDGNSVAEDIGRQAPDIVLVGMGVPRQEKWAWQNREILNARVIWCVGALFEYYGEGRPRAPLWMRKAGLEWLFRLVLEPRRLWRRYLVGNPSFVMSVLRWRLFK